jgi:hypothetical protein
MYGNRPVRKQNNDELRCQKTARSCRMEKTGIRMKVWEENWRVYGPELGRHAILLLLLLLLLLPVVVVVHGEIFSSETLANFYQIHGVTVPLTYTVVRISGQQRTEAVEVISKSYGCVWGNTHTATQERKQILTQKREEGWKIVD